MTPVKVGDRVKVVRGFSVGSKGTVIELCSYGDPYNCFVQRDQAGPTDRMAYCFDELALIIPACETPEEKEERLLTMAGVLKHDYTKKTAELLAKPDPVNSPSHYNTGGIECFDAMSAMLTREEMIGYLRGNSFKYRWRFRHKGGAEDLKKAEWYEKKLLGLIENSA